MYPAQAACGSRCLRLGAIVSTAGSLFPTCVRTIVFLDREEVMWRTCVKEVEFKRMHITPQQRSDSLGSPLPGGGIVLLPVRLKYLSGRQTWFRFSLGQNVTTAVYLCNLRNQRIIWVRVGQQRANREKNLGPTDALASAGYSSTRSRPPALRTLDKVSAGLH